MNTYMCRKVTGGYKNEGVTYNYVLIGNSDIGMLKSYIKFFFFRHVWACSGVDVIQIPYAFVFVKI